MRISQGCEICYKKVATCLTHNKEDNRWYYTCQGCLGDGYWIDFKRINDIDWEKHILGKTWVVASYFIPKFRWATSCLKVKKGRVNG